MKIFYNLLFLMLLSASHCWSQRIDTAGISIDKIPAEGILLNKGWKFHPGDNAQWAKPDVDDSNWDTIDPSKDIYYLPEVRKAEMGWFRLKLNVDSSLFNKALALIISQVGASEIYLNGRLLYKFGEVNKENEKEKTHYMYNRPFSFQFDTQGRQVFAVRYSFNRRNIFINYFQPNLCLQLLLKGTNVGFGDYISESGFVLSQNLLQIAFFILLGLMSLFLCFSFRGKIGFLYTGFYCLGQFARALLQVIANAVTVTSLNSSLIFLSHIVAVLSVFIMLEGFYILYNQQKSWLYKIIIVYALLTIPAFIFFYPFSGIFALSFYLVLNIETLRVLLRAVRSRQPSAWIQLTTVFVFYILFFSGILLFIAGNVAIGNLVLTISLLFAPIGFTFFLAHQFGRTGIALQEKLLQVERLSQQTLTQEQEKQQILATQNEKLEQQVTARTGQLQQSLEELKVTQKQLIQSEKMASLGELTAGIAHEIQNPLNFVNNFSEVNKELLEELKDEAEKGNLGEVKVIANDLIDNEEKISQHGKRADAIVKGMLQHSRASSGKKEPTDINALADEYLRLSYHGLRAKDKDFNADFTTHFDESIGKLEVVPQDIGRVLLNLYNNAFYAVNERRKVEGLGYEPAIAVATKREGDKATIFVSDNGPGIPQKVVDKIFQPFFTTKPTGQGTGLGLSLSYDIVKAHGGEIKVQSREGEGSVFIIQLLI